jgi:DNA-binding XRE family transcriptional regulator
LSLEIIVHNKIGEKIQEYQNRTGSTKVWIANRMGITKQALNILINTNNPTIESLVKISCVLQCHIFDLYTYEILKE